jgi:hypothetical protein
MRELLTEHIGEIALLIYILYPLFKRFRDRQKKKREQAGTAQETTAKAPARREAPRAPASRQPVPDPRPASRPEPVVAKRPTEPDFLAAARAQLDRLKQETSRLLTRAESDPRLVRLVPALREDLLGRLDEIDRSLKSSPTLSTIVQETTVLRGLDALLRYLKTMAQQRMYGGASFVGDADAMADACYAPILEFARAQGLDLRTSQPVVVTGDWDLSIVPRFASTRVAPLRLPVGFERSLWRWPAIAHEVAHDFYYSLEPLDRELHARLGLPHEVELPMSSGELDGAWLRQLFGAWLPEVFADVVGTVTLGPAYVETMRRAFRNPSSPQRTAAIFQDNALIDEHPPARLRLYMATRVLHHLGRHEEADALWERWEAEHAAVSRTKRSTRSQTRSSTSSSKAPGPSSRASTSETSPASPTCTPSTPKSNASATNSPAAKRSTPKPGGSWPQRYSPRRRNRRCTIISWRQRGGRSSGSGLKRRKRHLRGADHRARSVKLWSHH